MSLQFSVIPKECCHFISATYSPKSFLLSLRKHTCNSCNEKEIWICLHCLHIGCSRYCNGHAQKHSLKRGHPVVFNVQSMNFWCYECNSYVVNKSLNVLFQLALEDHTSNFKFYQPFFETYDVKGVAKYIRKNHVKNIIALVGAGMSTTAGIPDFRSPRTGLYFNLQKYNLPYPEAVFDMNYFPSNPAPFYEVMKVMFPGQGTYFPTKCHRFLKLLNDKGILKMVYTQNIDGLESVAGIPNDKVICSHGTFRSSHCLSCHKKYPDTSVFIESIKKGEIIHCNCGGLIKPDIVFFNESLPDEFFESIKDKFDDCDMLLIIGTALVVYPFANLVDHVPINCPRVCINREKVGKMMCYDNLGRDVALLGGCDDIASELAKYLEWELS
ncbi:Sir2 family transcriptional regulator, putative [Entamoeba histolytica HM-1:IMSS-B]|uniref:Sir2 family transcriptional regulator, putative n=5 Tax=Entamoeba histolytica TaxID=5759 RepID=C4LSH3_ENTH1|nr:Sir2 family transcriptional regulator, putative [Entamoeba histolytica HM-1:IMSS]EMD42887.1 NAD-dependent deacetylase sirtuin-2, putative [Entamoeba histolytica KU27]EMH74369.1 Sir2 family transcriptional regulator, putative [Entamoeba histolytica HM-1:IMSS-B]ENY63460.1 NAD-dependent deacetylase sirtuin-2, putative [Entamoeba histolytica HM-1:IMSS-A]GAT91377.1 sir2 family transcriptional regulator putative [Entamoeba histolytica]EAL52047.1 Sir2 family transcriptional regulator, putative [En|eukprot:XP_657434.1 Sir2 family transcriptional regulator, putative [Entamoeba histolytica HM-1:IMSS]